MKPLSTVLSDAKSEWVKNPNPAPPSEALSIAICQRPPEGLASDSPSLEPGYIWHILMSGDKTRAPAQHSKWLELRI